MSAYKFIDGKAQFNFIFPYQDILVSITEALKEQNFNAYIDIISHLRNMSILAFDEQDIKILENIDETILKFKKHVKICLKENIESESLYNVEFISSMNYRERDLKIFCEYRLSSVIERICIAALRKTILRDQVPEAQASIFYKALRDLELTIKSINGTLEEYDLRPCEVNL